MNYLATQYAMSNAHPLRNLICPQSLNILMVEDTATDEILTRRAVDATGLDYNLQVLNSGSEVLPYLARCIEEGRGSMPDVILLDLCMPGANGFEVLEDLSMAPPSIRSTPIVILTQFDNFQYICKGTNLCILGYIPKPCDSTMMLHILQQVHLTR